MKILLDTQIALWAWAQPERIPEEIRSTMTDPANEVWFCQVSALEIQIKFGLGRLPLPERPERFLPRAIDRSGFAYLSLQDAAIYLLDRLPDYHRDPFDRLLIAHSITGNYHLATVDPQIQRYPVLTVR
jgi:PIN domain nuclease of toxin-antitoxin system